MESAHPVVGVLALQGDVREHLRVLTGLGVNARPDRPARGWT
jgi:glutamine amidotransferase PdxT